jgi:hypothetical protein
VTVTEAAVLKAAGAGQDDFELAQSVLAEATAYVDAYIDENLIDDTNTVPDEVNDAAVLTCATDLFARVKAPFGQQLLPDGSGGLVPTRVGSDPLGGVRAKLRPWCFNIGFSYPLDDDET